MLCAISSWHRWRQALAVRDWRRSGRCSLLQGSERRSQPAGPAQAAVALGDLTVRFLGSCTGAAFQLLSCTRSHYSSFHAAHLICYVDQLLATRRPSRALKHPLPRSSCCGTAGQPHAAIAAGCAAAESQVGSSHPSAVCHAACAADVERAAKKRCQPSCCVGAAGGSCGSAQPQPQLDVCVGLPGQGRPGQLRCVLGAGPAGGD